MTREDLHGFEAWLHDRGLRPKSVEAYSRSVLYLWSTGNPMATLRKAKSIGRRSILLCACKSYARYLRDAGHALQADVLERDLGELPKSRLRQSPPDRPLDTTEWNRLLEAVVETEEPWNHVLVLLVTTGLRVSDVLNVTASRVQEGLQTGTVWLQQKGGEFRPFPVVGEVKTALQALLDGWEWDVLLEVVTVREKTKEMSAYMAVYRRLKTAAREAGLDPARIHPHLLRTTALVQLYRETKDLLLVQKWAGHKNITTTQRYLRHIDPEDLGEAYRRLQESRRMP